MTRCGLADSVCRDASGARDERQGRARLVFELATAGSPGAFRAVKGLARPTADPTSVAGGSAAVAYGTSGAILGTVRNVVCELSVIQR